MRALALILLLLFGCAKNVTTPEPQSACRETSFEGSRFTVCDPKDGDLLLFAAAKDERPVRSFAEITTRVDPKRLAFAMNAGMFDEDGRPIGLAIVNGVQLHRLNLSKGGGNFHLMPNGVFVVLRSGRAAIFRSDK